LKPVRVPTGGIECPPRVDRTRRTSKLGLDLCRVTTKPRWLKDQRDFYCLETKSARSNLVIPCARATRGRGLPSLDARTMGINQATPRRETKNKSIDGGGAGL